MRKASRGWDGQVVETHVDEPTGARIFIAIHSDTLGPPTGGTRLKSYPDPALARLDAERLSRGMTYKFAVLELPRGGAKGVIDLPGSLLPTDREGLLRRYARIVERLDGRFETGPDLGTGTADMDVMSEETTHLFGKSVERGGAGDPGPWTARGVFAAISAGCAGVFQNDSLSGRSILVQGAGHVGEPLMRLLAEAGAEIRFCDTDKPRINKMEKEGFRLIPPGNVLNEEVDVFSPCALGGILNSETIPRLQCGLVAGSANNQLADPEDAELLKRADIVYAPDFVINSGGAIFLIGREGMGKSVEWLADEVDRIGTTLSGILEAARIDDVSPDKAAFRLAEERLKKGLLAS